MWLESFVSSSKVGLLIWFYNVRSAKPMQGLPEALDGAFRAPRYGATVARSAAEVWAKWMWLHFKRKHRRDMSAAPLGLYAAIRRVLGLKNFVRVNRDLKPPSTHRVLRTTPRQRTAGREPIRLLLLLFLLLHHPPTFLLALSPYARRHV